MPVRCPQYMGTHYPFFTVIHPSDYFSIVQCLPNHSVIWTHWIPPFGGNYTHIEMHFGNYIDSQLLTLDCSVT